MLPVSLDCFWFVCLRLVYPYVASFSGLFLVCLSSSCVPYVASFSGLFLVFFVFVLCTLCCQFLCIVFGVVCLRLVYPMLPVSLYCFLVCLSSSCVPYVASFSGLFFVCWSSSCVPYVASFSVCF